ncbi:MAG: hypothetical protein V1720_08080 [bacterium]
MKTNFNYYLFVIIFLLTSTLFGQPFSEFESEFSSDFEILIKESNIIRKNAGAVLWKGWDDLQVPVIIVNDKYEFLFHDSNLTVEFKFYKSRNILGPIYITETGS